MKSVLFTLVALLTILVLPVQTYAASAPQISIPVKTIIRGEEGSEHLLAEKEVDAKIVGMKCEVKATAKNQGSVHPGNNIVVSSGNENVTLVNVEREANGLTEAEGQLTMSNELKVTLVLGKDKVFSGGMNVDLHCEEPKVIEVCRDGKVITIVESDKKDTDTSVPCPVEPVKPVEPPVLATATTLPNTGAGSMATVVAVTAIAGASIHSAVQRRKLQ